MVHVIKITFNLVLINRDFSQTITFMLLSVENTVKNNFLIVIFQFNFNLHLYCNLIENIPKRWTFVFIDIVISFNDFPVIVLNIYRKHYVSYKNVGRYAKVLHNT